MSHTKSRITLFLCISGNIVANAALISPTSISVLVPEGSNNVSDAPYTDDVLLDHLTFANADFSASSGQFLPGISLYVSNGRTAINAERGDNDTASDGNPDPFSRVGLNPIDYESTDPAYQDLALSSAFSTLSLVEGTDGEGASSTFSMTFSAGITDNDPGNDTVPELVIFERGNNDTSTIRAIIGGTYDNPTYAPLSVTINPGELWNTGISIDTFEIGNAQQLGAIGIDLSDFGTTSPVYGIEITSNGGDFYGQMLSPLDPETQLQDNVPAGLLNPLATVPEPHTLTLAALSALGLIYLRRR